MTKKYTLKWIAAKQRQVDVPVGDGEVVEIFKCIAAGRRVGSGQGRLAAQRQKWSR